MVALLAVMKSGAAYFPLDPYLPEPRLAYMLEDSEASRSSSRSNGCAECFPSSRAPILALDAPPESAPWRRNSDTNLEISVQPDCLAYVIYTSGSTGKPKGVEVSRGSLMNFLWSMHEWFGLNARDRVLAVTTISFDIAGLEILACPGWSARRSSSPRRNRRPTEDNCCNSWSAIT